MRVQIPLEQGIVHPHPHPVTLSPWQIPLEQGIVKAAEYFRNLDLRRFKKPTKHTAHANTEQESSAKKQKTS